MPFKRGDQVKIVKDFYANEAFEIARKNNIDNYTGIGEITKIIQIFPILISVSIIKSYPNTLKDLYGEFSRVCI